MTLSAGARLGPYEILSLLGAGGMGEVYRARDTRLERDVALKVLPEAVASDPARLRRFEQEARAASALNHPNIVTIYDVGREGRVSYIAMEKIDGVSLRERLAGGRLPVRAAFNIGSQIASGLAKAHASGLVHRDLKPENVMVTADGLVKILDFGLAKFSPSPSVAEVASRAPTEVRATEPGVILGTVGYMSPEQAGGRSLDFRSDQFSLGVILYEMAAGVRPFQRATAVETLTAILQEEPPPLGVVNPDAPEALRTIVRRCLAKEPEGRYASTHDLAHDLRSVSDTASAASPIVNVRGGRAVWIGAGIAVALAAVAAAFLLRRPVRTIDSLAVLPFVNASGDPNFQFLSDGITEGLINDIAEIPGLRVTSRASSFHYKGREVEPKAAARELGVQAVLTGRVERRGDDVFLGAELVDARDDRHLWGNRYDRKLSELMATQSQLVRDIAAAIHAKLVQPPESSHGSAKSGEAYSLYLKGRYDLEKWTMPSAVTALSYFRRATEVDPNFALAYAGIASCYLEGTGVGDPESDKKARAAIEKALVLDPSLSEAHTALANRLFSDDWNFRDAEEEFRKAIRLNPSSTDAHHSYSHFLLAMNRFDESLKESEEFMKLDPLSPAPQLHLASHYLSTRQYDKAIAQFQKTLAMDPVYLDAHRGLGDAYFGKGMYPEAAVEYRRTKELAGGNLEDTNLAIVAAASGDRAAAERWLATLLEKERRGEKVDLLLACTYAALGDREHAFERLERLFRAKDASLLSLKGEDAWNPLRFDPRFALLVRRVGLP